MLEIINADEMARKTLKQVLKDEIRVVNSEISSALKKRRYFCEIKEPLSEATIYLLRKAGYDVNITEDPVVISWFNQYSNYVLDSEIVDQIADELQLKIIGPESNNFPKKDED